ncbi:MAG: hypothetical protein C4522_22130 [Desulfobacteraceae bacterium]|nr:MAG: hypothetical protein C4522_22130 [Desulfobacteraceae bacterium]
MTHVHHSFFFNSGHSNIFSISNFFHLPIIDFGFHFIQPNLRGYAATKLVFSNALPRLLYLIVVDPVGSVIPVCLPIPKFSPAWNVS